MTGKTREAKQVYADIVGETAAYPFTVFQLALSHLTMTLNHVRNTLKKNNQLTLDSVSDGLMLPVKDAEDISEVHEHFYRMFDELGSKVEEKRTLKHEELIRKINGIIERDYADPNLCLTSIADELGMSPIYVSRLYKQLTLKGLTDVINETRIAKAQHLLVETENSVADIAEKPDSPTVHTSIACSKSSMVLHRTIIAAKSFIQRTFEIHTRLEFMEYCTLIVNAKKERPMRMNHSPHVSLFL